MIHSKIQTSNFDKVSEQILKCKKCELHKNNINYVIGEVGERYPNIIFCGEAPGAQEAITGKPFAGMSGKILEQIAYRHLGLTRGEYSILNCLRCRPPNNRDPTKEEKLACQFWLYSQLLALRKDFPGIRFQIICLGRHALDSLVRTDLPLYKARKIYYNIENLRAHIIPTYHPMATQYDVSRRELFIQDISSIRAYGYISSRKLISKEIQW